MSRSWIGTILLGAAAGLTFGAGPADVPAPGVPTSLRYEVPAGNRPSTRNTTIDGMSGAVINNGRVITPVGTEVAVGAPKPFGLALAPNGRTLATVNSGIRPFSVTLVDVSSSTPAATRINVDATFLGVAFSADSSRFFASGGENGNIWVGDVATAKIVGSINLNGATHPLDRPLAPNATPRQRFKGTFPGQLAASPDGRWLYVIDQGAFQLHVIDLAKVATGVDAAGKIVEPDNFDAVVARLRLGHYPFGVALSADARTLYVTHVGQFQWTHLRPANPTGDSNADYPLCFPGTTYPDDVLQDKTITISKVDPDNLPDTMQVAGGIRCGYIPGDITYTIPAAGDPKAPEASSVYAIDVTDPLQPVVRARAKTGLQVGEVEDGLPAYVGSHPNAVAIGPAAVYVSNGSNDSVSVLDPATFAEVGRIRLTVLPGDDRYIKGVQPVGLALSPDAKRLYVAEAGLNAVAVIALEGKGGKVIGHIPTGWWPAAVRVSADGSKLYVSNARGRGAGPNNDVPPDNNGSPRSATIGSVSIVPVPDAATLSAWTLRVFKNNGIVRSAPAGAPAAFELAKLKGAIKHVVFINKENLTHDLVLGDILATRSGAPVNGEPRYSLGYDTTPNHHELALRFGFSDNFYLEPSVSSDGHRWLANTYTMEFEETHWPASYGGRRRDAGDDPNVIGPYPGRLGFTDADGSPDPNDLDLHGGMALHVVRNGRSFVNFGNGYEFAIVDEDGGTAPTGIRQHVNIPMEKAIYDNSDHLYPEYNTSIPDAPLPGNPARFSRFGRFRQVFESKYVDRETGECKLPNYVDLFYPNDHGGGAYDINPDGPPWSFKRFVQDNDAALGYTVELLSHSPCWKDTVIFVVEDDTQSGFDHVDGHRSVFLAIGPWIRHGIVSHKHTSLSSVFKAAEVFLGLPALNLYDATGADLSEMFTDKPDFTPYDFTPIPYDGDTAKAQAWAEATKDVDFKTPDADDIRHAIAVTEGLPRPAVK